MNYIGLDETAEFGSFNYVLVATSIANNIWTCRSFDLLTQQASCSYTDSVVTELAEGWSAFSNTFGVIGELE